MSTLHPPGVARGDRWSGLWSAVAAGGMALLVLVTAGLPPGYPVNDSAAYHRMVELWWQNGHPTFIGWNEMTLLGHLAPAVLLRAVVGSSLAAEQIAVGLGAALLTAILAALLVRSGRRPAEAVPLALCWLASPVALVSATSFMTEVPQALWCAAWLAAFLWWCRTGRVAAAVTWAAFAVAAFSVRQTGVALPVASVLAVWVAPRARRLPTAAAAAAVLAADGALWAYRATLPLATVRPLSEMVGDLGAAGLLGGVTERLAEAVAALGLFLAPVAVARAARLRRSAVTRGGALVAAAVAAVLALSRSWFPFWPNTVAASGLLPDTLPPHGALPPVLPAWLLAGLTVLGVGSVAVLASRLLDRRRLREPLVAAAAAATVGLLALAALPASPFDRYLVPALPLALAAVAAGPVGGPRRRSWPLPGIGVLLLALVVSAASVRHLHQRQRAVWRIAEAQVAAGLPAAAVDGGFEWNLWHQEVPFDPAERRDPGQVLVWYESYPFTRLEPVRRLWIGTPPSGWKELSRERIPGGIEVLVLAPVAEGEPGLQNAARLEAVRSQIHDHIVATWTRALVAETGRRQPPLSAVEGEELVFYWDTYFTNAGLLRRPELVPLARANVDFLLGQVEAHGFAPNVNRPWGLNRSQPPYLAMMVRELWEAGGVADRGWLERAYRILQAEYRFWTTDEVEQHTTPLPGLLRYAHHATSDEATAFYDQVLVPRLGFAPEVGGKASRAGPLLAEAESGMDFTPRFEDRCSDFVAVDLNVNLVLYEQAFAWMVEELAVVGGPDWRELARERWRRIEATCWSPERGLFLDWDALHGRHSRVASAIVFHPLWAGLASPEQAARTVAFLPALEHPGGVAVCERLDDPSGRQWGEQAVWAPVQLLVISALDRYGYTAEASRVAARFLDTVARNWAEPKPATAAADGRAHRRVPGRLYEKYTADGRVNDLEYPAHEGLGWTAGVYIFAHDYLARHPPGGSD